MLIEVTEPSQAGEARRKALAYAETQQLSETRCGEVALATTEIATNLLKHARSGYILVQRLQQNGTRGLRIMGVDKGPGIANVSSALRDGHSTASSMGTGLGAVRRISDSFNLYSVPGAGTVIGAEFWPGKPSALRNAAIEIGFVSEPIRGEEANGDGWMVRTSADSVLLMVVDGLGHGILASEAARESERVFNELKSDSPEDILRETHLALRKTRGAAQAIARIDLEKGLLVYTGIGNISGSIIDPGSSRGMASHHGIVGQQAERVQQFSFPWNKESILVMHSDGLATRWDLQNYPGIRHKPASVIAAVLHRDFSRGRDDVTVLVAKAPE
jgi:anti-sigma regulatory factor (Ser/Thr protein kinase)